MPWVSISVLSQESRMQMWQKFPHEDINILTNHHGSFSSTYERKWPVFQKEYCSKVLAKRCGFSLKTVKGGVLLKSSISHHGIVKCFLPFWNPVRTLTYWEQPCREGYRSTGGSEPVNTSQHCELSPESQVYSGLHQKELDQQVESSDPPPQLVS